MPPKKKTDSPRPITRGDLDRPRYIARVGITDRAGTVRFEPGEEVIGLEIPTWMVKQGLVEEIA